MIRSRFASILLLASATSFAGWKVAYHPGNVATDRPPSAWDMAGNLWIWPTVSGTLQQVAPGKDSSSTANPSTGFVLPVNFAATGSGRLVTAFSYTALATSVDSGKRWDTLATVTRNYGIAAGRGIWIAPSLADYRGKSTGVVLSGTWDSKKVDTLVSSMAVGLNLGILPGDIPLVVRTWSTNLGVRYMSFHALKSPSDTSAGTILDTIAPTGSQRGLACNAAGCLFATDDSVWLVRSAPFSVKGFPTPMNTTNTIKFVTLTSTEAWVSTSGNGTHGVWRKPLTGGSWTLDNAGLGADSTKGQKLVSDGQRVALIGATDVYLNTSASNRVVRRAPAQEAFSLQAGRIALELAPEARGSLEVRSLDGRILSSWSLEDLGAGHHSLPVSHRGLHVVRLRTPAGETVRTGWSREQP
jgi:hypothetical protein